MWRWRPCACAPSQPDFPRGHMPFPPGHAHPILEAHFSRLLWCFPLQGCFLPSTLPIPSLGIGTTHQAPGTLGLHPSGLLAPWTLEWWAWVGCPVLLSFCLQTQSLPFGPSAPFSTQPTPWPDVSRVTGWWPLAVVGKDIQSPRSVSSRLLGGRRVLGGEVSTPVPKQGGSASSK